MKRALIVGIDGYASCPLGGCVHDARLIASLLEKNGDGSPNFSVKLLTSDTSFVSAEALSNGISHLFTGEADLVLLFFAGHGCLNSEMNSGYLVSQDGKRGSLGIPLSDIMGHANGARPKIKSTVIILDSCHSGYAGEVPALGKDSPSPIGEGVTILTACHREEGAAEDNGQGLFTSLLVDGLSGSSADICGRITPAALYSHIDQTLGAWEQRPIYKANVQTFVVLRTVDAKVPLAVLRRLPQYFPDAAYVFPLDPSYEPDRQNIPEHLRHLPVDQDHSRIFKELQLCNRYGLVTPVDAEHMYYAAIHSTGCKLTALGAHYRNLALLQRI
ncbi:MAG TPA: caspase family protein [Hyphomicrobium sp.]|jgi:hypothetical protein|nr:caspase family protein [Hyphomicrobium sp.]